MRRFGLTMSEKIWSDDAWDDYLYWQMQDKKTLKRINQLIKDIERNGAMYGIGEPEASFPSTIFIILYGILVSDI